MALKKICFNNHENFAYTHCEKREKIKSQNSQKTKFEKKSLISSGLIKKSFGFLDFFKILDFLRNLVNEQQDSSDLGNKRKQSAPADWSTNSEIEGSKAVGFSEGMKACCCCSTSGKSSLMASVFMLGSMMGIALRGSFALNADGRF